MKSRAPKLGLGRCGLGRSVAAKAGWMSCLGACLAWGAVDPALAQNSPPAPASPASSLSSPCSVQPAGSLPVGERALTDLLAKLDAMAPACLKDASFHAWRGAVLMGLRRPAAAIESLERALLIQPDLPGAQLDYAQALLAVGDTVGARALLAQVAARSDLPPGLLPVLQRELAETDPAAWRTRWILSTALGADSNLNNAPAASELTLTFPQGPVTLPLLDSSRPQSGLASLGTAQWQGLKPHGTQLWLLQAEIRGRHTAQATSRYQQVDLSANWLQAPEAPRQWVARAGVSRVVFGGQRLLESARASLLHQWQLPAGQGRLPTALACRPSVGAELETRRYPVSPELGGRYGGLVAAIGCNPGLAGATQGGFDTQSLSLQLRAGVDRADSATRPGGNYRRAEIRALWEGSYGPYKINADYGYTHQADATGYSVLLAANEVRRISRHSLRAEIARALPEGWLAGAEWFVSAEVNSQQSNLEAFASRQSAVYGGLRWTSR